MTCPECEREVDSLVPIAHQIHVCRLCEAEHDLASSRQALRQAQRDVADAEKRLKILRGDDE